LPEERKVQGAIVRESELELQRPVMIIGLTGQIDLTLKSLDRLPERIQPNLQSSRPAITHFFWPEQSTLKHLVDNRVKKKQNEPSARR
jgi:hypothetical protein